MRLRLLFLFIALTFLTLSVTTPCFADVALNHFNKGNKYTHEEKYQLAIVEYREAIKINSRTADFHYNLANILFVTDQLEEAIKEYQIGISLNPLDSDIQRNLGIAFIHAGEINKAETIMDNLKKMNPANAKQLEDYLNKMKK